MSLKKNLAVVSVVVVVVLASTLVYFLLRRSMTTTEEPSKEFPSPYIVEPRRDDRNPGFPVLITGDSVPVRALEMNRSEDVVWTRFEYNDGSGWRLIGEDRDPKNGLNLSRPTELGGLFEGFLGWEAVWDTRGLADGNYSLRATMKNRAGNTGSLEMKVSYERTGPAPRLEARQGQVVRGNWTFNVSTADADSQLYVLQYWDGSNSSHDQGPGVGGLNQKDAGPDGIGTGAYVNMFCAPTAAANGLMRMAQKDPRILNAKDVSGRDWVLFINQNIAHYLSQYPDDPKDWLDRHDEIKYYFENQTKIAGPYASGGNLTNVGLAMVLGCKMRTDIENGTTYDNARDGLQDFLREQGIDGNYTVSGWDAKKAIAEGAQNGSAWANLTKVIRENETVIVNILRKEGNDTSLHALTAKDFKVVDGQRGPPRRWVSVVDPRGGTKDIPFVEDNSGNGGLIYEPGKAYYITNITSVSPDDSTRQKYYAAAFLPVKSKNFDDNGRDGWAVAWDTSTVDDGFYLVRATLVDDRRNLGRDTVEVLVDNHMPTVSLQAQVLQGTALLSAFEGTGSEDVEFMTFSYSRDGQNWTVIGTDEDGADGWGMLWSLQGLSPGSYMVRALTTDYAGNDGYAVSNVTVPQG